LSHEEEKWLCDNAFKNNNFLNRVLRYPICSSVISQWVKDNYNNDALRERRSELLSWIVNEDQKHEVSIQTLIDDFEYFYLKDTIAKQEYEHEHISSMIIKHELGEYVSLSNHDNILDPEEDGTYDFFILWSSNKQKTLSIPHRRI
jgi:hypothetical protein